MAPKFTSIAGSKLARVDDANGQAFRQKLQAVMAGTGPNALFRFLEHLVEVEGVCEYHAILMAEVIRDTFGPVFVTPTTSTHYRELITRHSLVDLARECDRTMSRLPLFGVALNRFIARLPKSMHKGLTLRLTRIFCIVLSMVYFDLAVNYPRSVR